MKMSIHKKPENREGRESSGDWPVADPMPLSVLMVHAGGPFASETLYIYLLSPPPGGRLKFHGSVNNQSINQSKAKNAMQKHSPSVLITG